MRTQAGLAQRPHELSRSALALLVGLYVWFAPQMARMPEMDWHHLWLGGRIWRWGLGLAGAVLLVALSVYVDRNLPARNRTISFDYPSPPLALDCGDGVTMNLVRILPGTFMMGSNQVDREQPPHEVAISKPFYLGKFEVTQAQWRAVMGINPSNFKGDDLPVENVSWDDCQEFCRKLSVKTGKTVRLPTEAEWEYACRAGSQGKFCFGNDYQDLDAYAWYPGNAKGQTHPVGKKLPNAWGLYDMHGNVWEWCADRYEPYTGSTAKSEGFGEDRILRGGSWNGPSLFGTLFCRCAHRNYYPPGYRLDYYGFRLALDSE